MSRATRVTRRVALVENKSEKRWNITSSIGLLALLILSMSSLAYAIDIDAGMRAAVDPVKKMINDYFPVGIFIAGAFGAFMQQGDLRERMMGFGKGALAGGLVVTAVKAGLGV